MIGETQADARGSTERGAPEDRLIRASGGPRTKVDQKEVLSDGAQPP